MTSVPVVALAGNPNTGKTSIFNQLTGSRQHVGNWPGKTVECKSGRIRRGDLDVEVVDLPGTYSLSAYSLEESIARNFVVDEHPDAVVVVVDATNLERNLYLVAQVRELGVPVVVAMNMSDRADAQGIEIDVERLGCELGAAVVRTVAREGDGVEPLVAAIAAAVTDANTEGGRHEHRQRTSGHRTAHCL